MKTHRALVTSYLIASRIFHLEAEVCVAISAFCAGLIYLLERLVLATPKTWAVNLGRVLIGVVISTLGASAVDLVIFEREVSLELRAAGETRIAKKFGMALHAQKHEVQDRKAEWLKARDAASCEANGTCGSLVRNVGPVYQEMARQADLLRKDYEVALAKQETLERDRAHAIAEWRDSPRAIEEAGLLSRVEALHRYTMDNTAALVAWLLFFVLVLSMELMVVLVKLVFGETVDDYLNRVREEVSQHRARSFLEATTSPLTGAQDLLRAAT